MENVNKVVTASDALSTLATARHQLVKGASKTGEVIKYYAGAMCAAFNVVGLDGNVKTPWFELKGKDRAGVKIERDAFKAEMESAGFDAPTVDVYWQRVKVASGYVTSGKRAKGNATTDEKTRDDLKTLINRIFKAEENGEECSASSFKGALIEVFQALGGDVDLLG